MSQVPTPNYYYQNPGPVTGQTSGWAVFSLIAGILAWLGVFGLGGIAAVIAGYIARSEINASGGRISGSGMATAGLVLGYINIALTLLGICLIALAFAGLIASPAVCAPFMNNINTNFSFIP
jgi:hypothetical protein